ncbi:MAG: hypothetical protein ACREL5_05320 [Gemmatimonadales bacterium]
MTAVSGTGTDVDFQMSPVQGEGTRVSFRMVMPFTLADGSPVA